MAALALPLPLCLFLPLPLSLPWPSLVLQPTRLASILPFQPAPVPRGRKNRGGLEAPTDDGRDPGIADCFSRRRGRA
jgi:hypothetical protein